MPVVRYHNFYATMATYLVNFKKTIRDFQNYLHTTLQLLKSHTISPNSSQSFTHWGNLWDDRRDYTGLREKHSSIWRNVEISLVLLCVHFLGEEKSTEQKRNYVASTKLLLNFQLKAILLKTTAPDVLDDIYVYLHPVKETKST